MCDLNLPLTKRYSMGEFHFIFHVLTLCFILLLSFLLLKYFKDKQSELPPGPTGYPVVGSLSLIKDRPMYEVFRDLREGYGDIFSVRLGSQLFVVINGYGNICDAFIKQADDFSDRPDTFVFKDVMKEKGIVSSSGKYWKHTRSWLLKSLRNFGFGRKSIEFKIKEEIETFLEEISKRKGEPYDIKDDLQTSIANIICSITFGQRFSYNDTTLKHLVDKFETNFKMDALTGRMSFFPYLKHLPGDIFGMRAFLKNVGHLFEYLTDIIAKHDGLVDEDSSDLLGEFLREQKNSQSSIFDDENLMYSIHNLFVAGVETTSSVLRWGILFLLHNRDVLDRIRTEIENAIGSSRLPTLDDRQNMPYCQAVIAEILRCGNIAPLSLTHGAKKNIRFKGYLIPKGSVIVPNLDSVMNDQRLFPNPEKFFPERFLIEENQRNGIDKVIAFSLGRRVCIGESLARSELFLYLTSLLQRFELLPEADGAFPTLCPTKGAMRRTLPYRIRLIPLSTK